VVGAEAGLADGQSALVQGAGAVQVALVAKDEGEVVEAEGGVGVVGA
jgi:translation initiation factor 2B subunit (eIF-2B alpha/beta/delta family)